MQIRHIPSRIAGIALTLALVACGSTPQPQQTERGKPSESPDVLIADAMQRQGERLDMVSAHPLIKMAFDKAPDRADIAWLYAQLCANVAGCHPESAEARLRRLDPDNTAAWLGALSRAQRAKDVAAENEILEAMSRTERFDIYWNSLASKTAVVMSADSAAQMGPTTPDLVTGNLNVAIGWLSAVALPAFKPLADACLREGGTNPVHTQRCQGIANAMVKGDTYIAEGIGLSIRKKVAPPGSAEAAQVDELLRRSRYQRDTAGQIIAIQDDREKFSREMIKLMANLRREQDVYVAVIRWGQQPVDPPADWEASGF
jgi:hypothetical protein